MTVSSRALLSDLRGVTAKDLLELTERHHVRFVRLQFTDILGVNKNVEIPTSQLPKALAGDILFDGSSIEGFVRVEESDMLLRPDLDTFRIFPWTDTQARVARLICDITTPEGDPFAGDPRGVLKRQVTRATSMGYTMFAGMEAEFFLFRLGPDGGPSTTTHDVGSYFDLGPVDLGEDARRAIVDALEQYDHLQAGVLEALVPQQVENLRWVRQQLLFCVILTLNNAFYHLCNIKKATLKLIAG